MRLLGRFWLLVKRHALRVITDPTMLFATVVYLFFAVAAHGRLPTWAFFVVGTAIWFLAALAHRPLVTWLTAKCIDWEKVPR